VNTATAAHEAEYAGRIRIAIIEDHGLFADALAYALEAHGYGVEVVRPTSPFAIVERVAELRPDIALLDLHLGTGGSGVALIDALRRAGTDVICMTGETSRAVWGACIEAGALTVLNKARSFDDVLAQVQSALTGDGTMPVAEREAWLYAVQEERQAERVRLEPFQRLTIRECEVLEELVEGHSAEAIATRAFVSLTTVRTHIRSILQKLGVSSQLAAAAMAVRANWSSPHARCDGSSIPSPPPS